MSPCLIGCRETGWADTEEYIRRFGPLTLASAMAASGAAINSNAGYVGAGLTRNSLISAAMTIFNMRLGIWIGNPAKKKRPWLGRLPTYLHPMLTCGLLGFGNKSTSSFVELSDGGNFDNLGLYELIRRKLRVIVVVDGEADATIALRGLVSVATRVKEDFKSTISFVEPQGPSRLIPNASASAGQYPSGAHFAHAPYMLGTVKYSDAKDDYGVIIYIKATLVKDLAFTTAGYRAEFADFPHQSTVDQFFDPIQFEAYRDLGYTSASRMIEDLKLAQTMASIKDIEDEYAKLK